MRLKKGETKCDKCNGVGWYEETTNVTFNKHLWHIDQNIICDKCRGTGKLDWIERIVGKRGIIIWGQKNS